MNHAETNLTEGSPDSRWAESLELEIEKMTERHRILREETARLRAEAEADRAALQLARGEIAKLNKTIAGHAMTQHERAVIEAAKKWDDAKHNMATTLHHSGFDDFKDAEQRLRRLVSALRQAERKELAK